ncbi:MAG: OmpA family protein [Candidatus Marinimicrobia bacterium]|jgi:chemotaxis protein MotB|nr:OmpA family protein [Candidatus Neomarinimicrobiota bacterium]
MADEVCPLCDGNGAGLPGYFGTMADMFTLLFAFFVILFSLSSTDPAGLVEGGGDEAGAAKQEEEIEEIEKQAQELKEQGVTEIDDKPIEEYMDSLIQDLKAQNEPPPKSYEMHEDLAEIIEEMELDSSEAKVEMKDPRGTVVELNGNVCFDAGEAAIKEKLKVFLDAAVDSFLTVPSDNRQIIVEGHTDNWKPTRDVAKMYPTNWELSSARASAVVSYLIDKGVNPSRLVSHGYAERWPADMSWENMRRGAVQKPRGENVEIVEGRGGKPEYTGVDTDKYGNPLFDEISMDSVIDSLNRTKELRAKNRRIKIIFTQQKFVDGLERYENAGK